MLRGTTKASVALVALAFCSVATALPVYWDTISSHYKPPSDSALFKAKCVTCHESPKSGSARNPFGKSIEEAMHGGGKHDVTAALLASLEPHDSDHDQFSNIEEIRSGSLPGDSTSHPAAKEGSPSIQPPAHQEPARELVPKHSFHPLIVHFPIALFIVGAILDALGRIRRSGEIRRVAVWNLVIGAVASLFAIPTGVAAWLRVGFSLQGVLLTHVILASTASVIMLGVAWWRFRYEADSPLYWTLLALGTGAVAAAGHFGALLVYG